MDETKHPQPAYSGERLEAASVQIPQEPAKTAESSATQPAEQFAGQMQESRLSGLLEIAENLRHFSLADIAGFLKRTWRVWVTVAGVAFGLIATVTVAGRVVEWARNARESRHELAVATVTPDRLIGRCGEAAQDATIEVFPIVMRTMSYQTRGNQKLVFAFSRTAEQNSDWVFLSMNDENGAGSYDTADAKIAALPCLDSNK
jgi:hypothetical protein